MTGRVLGVDPGEKRLGIALSDPSGTIASVLTVLNHVQLKQDCQKIIDLALFHQAELIVVGQALSQDGEETRQSRHSQKIAECLSELGSIPIQLWDESGSTRAALQVRIDMGTRKKDRHGHLDDLAAAIILQSFLDAQIERNLL